MHTDQKTTRTLRRTGRCKSPGSSILVLIALGASPMGQPQAVAAQGLPAAEIAQRDEALESVSWMTGCWVARSQNSLSEEVWLKPLGGLMIGTSRVIRGGVAVGYELLRLHVVDGRLLFSAHPSGQAPADFAATRVGPDLARFENPAHDSPQRLEYRRATPDSLFASVFAATGDAEPAFVLRYAREACGP